MADKEKRATFAQQVTDELASLVRDAKRSVLEPKRLTWLVAGLRALESDSVAFVVDIAEELYMDDRDRYQARQDKDGVSA